MRCTRSARGFTLIELAVVVIVLGMVLAFAIPSFQSFNQGMQLKGAAQNIVAQLNLARQKAISTGQPQTIHFYYGTFGWHYHIHNPSTTPGPGWNFPQGILYSWDSGTLVNQNVTMQTDGRADKSGWVILVDRRGDRDTISVQRSGLVLLN